MYILFNSQTLANVFAERLWTDYLATQPEELKNGRELYSYTAGKIDKRNPTVKFCDVTVADDGKAFVFFSDNDITTVQESTIASYNGEVKTYQWMVDNDYVEDYE